MLVRCFRLKIAHLLGKTLLYYPRLESLLFGMTLSIPKVDWAG
jgi:hypothetical protein